MVVSLHAGIALLSFMIQTLLAEKRRHKLRSMSQSNIVLIALLAMCLSGYIAAIVVFRCRRTNSLGTVSPVGEKMLRPAGYSLRNRTDELLDSFLMYLLQGFIIPVVLGFGTITLASKIYLKEWSTFYLVLGFSLVAMVAGWVIGGILAYRKFNEWANCRLGLAGEELVAQHLNPLYRNDYRIYHDFPVEGRKDKGNIDHIVIGPTGVFVIETKMRRKHKKLKTGREFQKVEFTGDELIYPNFRDRHGLGQTEANAQHLQEFIKRKTGHSVSVAGILALPGWYVNQTGRGRILVRNHKSLAKAILSRPGSIDRKVFRDVAVAVRERCCDVDI